MRAKLLLPVCAIVVGAVPQVTGFAAPQKLAADDAKGVRSMHVQGNVWVTVGAGGNITVQVSDAKAPGPGAPAKACCSWTRAARK